MRIAFANATRKWGGVKSWTLDVAAGLLERGHEVLVLARPGAFLERAQALGCRTAALAFGPDYNPAAMLRAAAVLRRFRPGVLVGNVGKDLRTAGLAARLLGIPVVHRVGLAGDVRPGAAAWLDALLLRPHLLAPCQQVLDGVRHNPALRTLPGTVIRTGKPRSPRPSHGRGTPLRLVSASQLTPDKDHATALTAVAALVRQGVACHYSVLGTGPLAQELAQLARDLGLEGYVTWHGFVADVPARLAGADILLLPSRSEGLPNALLEAMAAGLVCLARDVGGIAEVWPPEARWLLLPPDAGAEALTAALTRLAALPEAAFIALRQTFWQALPSREAMLDGLEALFTRLGGRR